ncbi:MAG: hypothetical protein IPK99_03880 [Flavobacteriales bacterium]|nr:hypothetical protein [Flavobacteriales bacterium]
MLLVAVTTGGQRAITVTNYDQWLLRVDGAGAVLWEEEYGSTFDDGPNAHVTASADGNALFATGWAQNNNEYNKLGMTKVDSAGGLIWSKTYGASHFSAALFTVKEVDPGGDLIAAGVSFAPVFYEHGALLRTDGQGDSLWLRYYHYYDSLWTEGKGRFYDVVPLDNGFIAVGTAFATSNNPNDPTIRARHMGSKGGQHGLFRAGLPFNNGCGEPDNKPARGNASSPQSVAQRNWCKLAGPAQCLQAGGCVPHNASRCVGAVVE